MGGLEHYVPGWLLAVAGILVVVTSIAAAARKPPLSWIGHYLGWVLHQLIGTPLSAWLARETEDRVRPIVREEVAAVAADVKHLHDCVESARKDAVAAVRAAEGVAATTQDTNAKVTALGAEVRELAAGHERIEGFMSESRADRAAIHAKLNEREELIERALPLIEQAEPLLHKLRAESGAPGG